MAVANLWHWSYWFSGSGSLAGKALLVFLLLFLLLALAGLVLKITRLFQAD